MGCSCTPIEVLVAVVDVSWQAGDGLCPHHHGLLVGFQCNVSKVSLRDRVCWAAINDSGNYLCRATEFVFEVQQDS